MCAQTRVGTHPRVYTWRPDYNLRGFPGTFQPVFETGSLSSLELFRLAVECQAVSCFHAAATPGFACTRVLQPELSPRVCNQVFHGLSQLKVTSSSSSTRTCLPLGSSRVPGHEKDRRKAPALQASLEAKGCEFHFSAVVVSGTHLIMNHDLPRNPFYESSV